jgi:hypothetical protein
MSDPIQGCGISFSQLGKLVESKLATSNPSQDLGDVQELIKVLPLPRDFAEQLDSSVRDKFLEMWDRVHAAEKDEDR